ncbi:hypothetical protein M9H77_06101 [Catharanthus roseus]|uniref:Uncharacterized protein n=1 Tax=Catharanthus roseus TaxID=4058 RepID=A0ACC0BR47_CATRO|nr:hypothetical protein M9H77_06101 [Catharanthus roseus]
MAENSIVRSFENFFQGWLNRREQYHQELIQAITIHNTSSQESEIRNKELIIKILNHYSEYYTAKTRITQEDVFLLFCPPWLSSFEHSYLWLTGFRPLLAFRLIATYDLELSEDQSQRINSLREEIKREIFKLQILFCLLQAPTLVVALAEDMGHIQNGVTVHLDSTMDIFKTSMEALVQCADYLRGKTLVKILEILSSSQTVKFLATFIQYQLSIRRYGQRRHGEHQRPNVIQQENPT